MTNGYKKLDESIGYSINDVPKNITEDLDDIINKISSNHTDYELGNFGLAGNIEREYRIKNLVNINLEKFILDQVTKFNEYNNNIYINSIDILNQALPFYVDQIWINFQKKYEFNPLHSHSGLYSFVIWHKIPYTIEEEQNFFKNVPIEKQKSGQFNFVISTHVGIISVDLSIDKKCENKICIFPSKLNHIVYPFFTSNNYRITISGNIKLLNNS